MHAAGLRLATLQEGSGPDLLLLHGVGGSMHGWAGMLSRLVVHFRVTALDLPGHGFSDLPSDDRISLDGISEIVGALLRELGCTPEVVVGHSAGAGIAVKMVLDGRIAPKALVGVNPSLVPPTRMPMPTIVERMARPFVQAEAFASFWSRFGKVEWVIRKMIASTGSTIPEAQFQCYRRIARQPAQVHAALTMMSNWRPELLVGGFEGLTARVPVVRLIAGSRDEWIPEEEVRRVAARIPGAELLMVAAGHLAPEECPDRIAELVRSAPGARRPGA